MALTSALSRSADTTSKLRCPDPVYIYGIIPTHDRIIFDPAGVDQTHEEVYTIPYHRLSAVVSRTQRADYSGLGRQEAVGYLVAHQRVVESVMRDFPIIPARFGTVLGDERQVLGMLNQGCALFETTLAQLTGRAQVEVVVLWNLPEVFQAISQDERIVRLKTLIAERPPTDTMAERVEIGRVVQTELARRRTELREAILPSLQSLAADTIFNPLMDDSMVLNVGLLLDEGGRQALDSQLEVLDREFDGKLRFRRVGPLPPYSFASVEVTCPSFAAIDEARQCLGVPESCSQAKIKQSFHQLATQVHPDHAPDDPQAEKRMAELTKSYRLLTAFIQSQALSSSRPGQPDAHAAALFDREAVDRTLLIQVRRQETAG
jgi:hypothetical protein